MRLRNTSIFAAGVAAALLAGWYGFPRILYASKQQPLAFNHKVHADKAGSKCEDCHAITEAGAFAGIPPIASCAGCHPEPVGETAAEKELVAKYVKPNREIPWLVYSRQPDNVRFSHATHVKTAKLACERCHGTHGTTTALRTYQENRISGYSRDIWGHSIARISFKPGEHPGMKMDDCAACHKERGVQTSCMACHK